MEEAGRQPQVSVWRLEFQFKRQVLDELGILRIPAFLDHLGGLWRYGTDKWLRLSIPSKTETNQSRWPIHPLWDCLSQIDWNSPSSASLVRVQSARVPSDTTLFVNGFAAITSFMAREGITNLEQGFTAFLASASNHHNVSSPERDPDRDFSRYVKTKVALKGKRYNTIPNQNPLESVRTKVSAENYRNLRDGE